MHKALNCINNPQNDNDMKRNYMQPQIAMQTCIAGNHLCAGSPDIFISSETIDPGTIGD